MKELTLLMICILIVFFYMNFLRQKLYLEKIFLISLFGKVEQVKLGQFSKFKKKGKLPEAKIS